MTFRSLAAVLASLMVLAILIPTPAEAGGRYSGHSRAGDALRANPPLGNSFTGRYAGEARFTEKSTFRNSENNRSQFRNSFARRSVFGNRVDRTSRLKHRFNLEAASGRPFAVLPYLEIFQPADRTSRPTNVLADQVPLDPAVRRAIAQDLTSIFARNSIAEAGSPQ